jgi:hypothetical protein
MIRLHKKMLFMVAVLVGSAILGAPTQSQAGYSVQVYDDGVLQAGITVMVSGNSLLFSGSTTHFSISNGSGTSNNPGTSASSNLDLSTNEQITALFGTAGGTHTIKIVLSQTGFTAPTGTPVALASSASGSISGSKAGKTLTVSSTYQGFLDNTNTLFGQPAAGGTPAQSGTASVTGVNTSSLVLTPSESTANVPGATPFSMTDVVTFTFTVQAGSKQDTANIATSTVATAVVPAPPGLVLGLTAFPVLCVGMWLRRRWLIQPVT